MLPGSKGLEAVSDLLKSRARPVFCNLCFTIIREGGRSRSRPFITSLGFDSLKKEREGDRKTAKREASHSEFNLSVK